MKKTVLAGAMLAALAASPTLAADMAVKAPPPPPAPVSTWNGCYIGGNVGGGWVSKDWANPEGSPPGDRGTAHFSGLVGGGQVGCDFQLSGPWVIGVQGMFDGADLHGDVIDTENTDFDLTARIHWFATAAGRLGYLIKPNVLLYGGGGGAWVRDHYVELDLGAPFDIGDVTRSGWVALGGLEWMVAPRWSVFLQYDFMDFGTRTDPLTLVAGGSHTFDIKQQVQSVVGGINFRFGGPLAR